ncbi:MAG: hypothetical protein QOH83_2877 [Solirubrobacteraceae bacterium]|nr:hypothetical protein [Solirubrobacteraceae bacterium]
MHLPMGGRAGVADGDEHRDRQAGAIYGQVVSTSTVAALALDEGLTAVRLLVGVIGVMLTFWLAHAYAELIADRVGRTARCACATWAFTCATNGPSLRPPVRAQAPAGRTSGARTLEHCRAQQQHRHRDRASGNDVRSQLALAAGVEVGGSGGRDGE